MHGLYHKNLEVVKLVIGLHQWSPRVMELKNELHLRCSNNNHRSLRVVKLEMGLHHGSVKVVEFMIEPDHGSLKDGEVSDKTSP